MKIWVPQTKIIEPKRQLGVPLRLRGFFKLEATDRRGRRRVLADWFPNLITDAGLNVIGTAGGWLLRCRVGTGSSAPDVSDTELDALVAANSSQVSNNPVYAGAPDHHTARTIVYRFDEGVAAGNLAEVGIATSASGATLFSRALILDGSGNPATITVLADETLDVTYQLRIYPPLADVVDTITIGGVLYDYTLRASNVHIQWPMSANGSRGGLNSITGVGTVGNAYSGAIGAINAIPSGTAAGITAATDNAYGNGDLYRDGTWIWGLAVANFGGIRSFQIPFGTDAGAGAIQVEMDPVIPKDATKVLSMVFRHIWARGTI